MRLAMEGDLQGDDWIDFDDRLTRYWKQISGREHGLHRAARPRIGRRELSEHLDDYTAGLTAKNRDADYVRWNESRARLVIDKCKAKYAADLTPSAVQAAIGELRDGGASLATCNTYIRSIKGFTKWLARDRRTR